MNQPLKLPDPEKVKQRAARMREICLMFGAQILLLDELIAQVEAENQNNPIKRLVLLHRSASIIIWV